MMMTMEQKRPGPPKQRRQRLAPPTREPLVQASDADDVTPPPTPKGKIAVVFCAALLFFLVALWYLSHKILLPHAFPSIVATHCHDVLEDVKRRDIGLFYEVGLQTIDECLEICAEIHYPGAKELLAAFRSANTTLTLEVALHLLKVMGYY